jgi:hypothetical protein
VAEKPSCFALVAVLEETEVVPATSVAACPLEETQLIESKRENKAI